MQSTKSSSPHPANDEGNRQAFWNEMRAIAERGQVRPETLTAAEISKICQLTILGMTRRDERRKG